MKKWAMVVVALYGLMILIFTIPALVLAFLEFKEGFKSTISDPAEVFTYWPYWAGFALFVAAQAALLDVHVNMAERRPVTRRTIVPVVLFSSLMMALLVLGAALAIEETIRKGPDVTYWLMFSLLGLSWLVWGFVFYRWSKNIDPQSFLGKMQKYLFRGSILELLVAVPTHIIARSRDYCCAGINTFVGIVFGLAVMACSFGPGVFFLFAERWKRLHPEA